MNCVFEKREVSESQYSCDPTAGASPDPIFLLPERSVKPEVRKDRTPRHCPRSRLAAPRTPEPLSRENEAGKTQAHLSWPPTALHKRGSRSVRTGPPQRNPRAPATRKDARPARPSRPLREARPLPVPWRPACSEGRSRGTRISTLQSCGFHRPLTASQRRSVPARWHRRLT